MSDQAPQWHALNSSDVLENIESDNEGLSASEAEKRLKQYGPNALPSARRRPLLLRFFSQFHNVFIYVLLGAAVIAAVLDLWIDTAVILAVVMINAVIGFVQEGKAEQAMAAIGKMLAIKAQVRRDGQWHTVNAETLVPGDIVRISAGDRVPADIRLIRAHGLRVDQAALTGESVPVGKSQEPDDEDTELADRRSMAYSGSMTTNGQANGVVVVTGKETELGRISGMLETVQTLTTPLLKRINRFAKILTLVIVTLAMLVIALGALVHGLPLAEGLIAGIALAVAAIPEGLPAIITITLAIGVRQMALRKAIIRRLPAVETLGSVSIICSDKTGTLTRNQLKALAIALTGQDLDMDEHSELRSEAARHLFRASVLCNDYEPDSDGGDPLEMALVEMADRFGLNIDKIRDDYPRSELLPFSSDTKFMATLHSDLICVKGAPEALLERCKSQLDSDDQTELDGDYWKERLDELTGRGLRVLAIAEARVDRDSQKLDDESDVRDLTLLGLVGFADPPRAEVPEAVEACQSAGIRVKMITGDHASTALAIARELKITSEDRAALAGREIDRMDDDELAEQVLEVDVFARTTPEHKLRLVKALQAHDHVVAMTGDGANDAPALKRADIGVAMGIKGTEASRQAAEMVLADDNFATIVNGVEEGRGVYDNIRKAVLFVLPTNAAQALVIVLAVLAGMNLPISPVQILWINMAIAVTLALALAFEPLESDIMKRQPRKVDQGLLTSFVISRVLWVGAVLTTGTFLLYHHVLTGTGDEDLARTVAVNVLVAGQITYLFNCRRWQQAGYTFSALFSNGWAWVSVSLLVVMQLLFTYLPWAQTIFSTTSLPASYWPIIIAFGLAVFALVEIEKAITRHLKLDWASPEGR